MEERIGRWQKTCCSALELVILYVVAVEGNSNLLGAPNSVPSMPLK